MAVVNASMFLASGGLFFAGGAAVAGGCLNPTPFEPATCIAGSTAAGITFTAGGGTGKFAVDFFKNYTLPAIKGWGCDD